MSDKTPKVLTGQYYPELRPLDLTFSIVQTPITCDYQSFWNGSSTAIIQWSKSVMNHCTHLKVLFFLSSFFSCVISYQHQFLQYDLS